MDVTYHVGSRCTRRLSRAFVLAARLGATRIERRAVAADGRTRLELIEVAA